jgi:hypothetical protein
MNRTRFLFLGLLLCSGSVHSASIAINNPGFESPVLADGAYEWGLYPFNGPLIGGWSTAGNVGSAAGIINPTAAEFSGGAPDGENVGFLISYNSAWLIQTLATTYQQGETYTLTALVGDAGNKDLFDFNIGLSVGGSLKSTMDAAPLPADDGWSLFTASVVADASMHGQPIEIRLYSSSGMLVDDPDSTDRGVYFDSLALNTTAVVPVPAALWLFASGLGLLGWLRVSPLSHRRLS